MVSKNDVMENKEKLYKNTYTLPFTDCVFFNGYLDKDGYGQFQFRSNGLKKNIQAHRASYIIQHEEELTIDDVIMHSCDTPDCINPLHLSKGTHNDNVQDRVAKGRNRI